MSSLSQFFMNPAFVLPGAALVLIPIIIHILSRLRYRKVRFAAMEFLLESEELNRRRIILEQLLQLLLRILAVLLFVLLIGRLLLDPGRLLMLHGASVHHVVLLDDSLSMRDREGDETVFREALTTLESMLTEGSRIAGGSARVTILSMSDPRRPIVSDRSLDGAFVQEFAPRLRNLPCSWRSASPVDALQAAKDILAADGSVSPQVHVLTDLRASDWNNRPEVTEALESLKSIKATVDLIQVSREPRPNIAISQLSADTLAVAQGVLWRLTATVVNHGASAANGLRATVFVDGTALPGKMLLPSIEPGASVPVSHDLSFESEGRHVVEVRLDDDALREDNRRFLAVEVSERRSVLIVDDDGQQDDAGFIAAALSADPALTGLTADIRASQALTAGDLPKYDCVYLLNVRDLPADTTLLLAEYVRNGGGIVWFPGDQANLSWYSETLRTPEQKLFPVPLGTVRQAIPTEAVRTLTDDTPTFVTPVFEPHPIFAVYNTPDSPFPDTVQLSSWLQVTTDWKNDDTERGDGVRTLMRLKTGEPVAFEHALGKGRVLTFLTGGGRRWSNWPVAPAAPGFVVMHLLIHQYLQKPVDTIEQRELTEPLRLQWPSRKFTETMEVYLPEAGPGEEPVAETFVRLEASAVNTEDNKAPAPSDPNDAGTKSTPNTPTTSADPELAVTVPQAERPGVYRIRRFSSEGVASDLAVALNVPTTESALTIADAALITSGGDLGHVRVLEGDSAEALGGSNAGRELRWVLLGLLMVTLIAEQLISLRLSYHPEVAR
ncbi:MAG: BatA domain-containing protein [Planctomycetaceae bacterium]